MALNLVQHRGGSSIWDHIDHRERNVARWLMALLAGTCLVTGLRQRSTQGLLLAVSGGALAWWAAAGADERTQWRSQLSAAWPRRRGQADVVSEASEESFPASDAPSWTPTTASTGPAAADATPNR